MLRYHSLRQLLHIIAMSRNFQVMSTTQIRVFGKGIVVAISTAGIASTMRFIRLLDDFRLVISLSSMCRTLASRKTLMYFCLRGLAIHQVIKSERGLFVPGLHRLPFGYRVDFGATRLAVAIVHVWCVWCFGRRNVVSVVEGVEIGSTALDFCANR